MKVIVRHAYYGCDTGCCGHIVEVDGKQVGAFQFDHPYGKDPRAYAISFARDVLAGAKCEFNESDLDWESCDVFDD